MEIRVTGRHFEVNDEIRKYLENKIDKLNRYFSRIVEIHAILEKEKYRCTVEVTIKTNTGLIVAQHENQDMLLSIDYVINKLERQLKKLKERRRDLKRHPKETKYEETPASHTAKSFKIFTKVAEVNKVFPQEMTIDDAITELNSLDTYILPFLNSETKDINILIKRTDHTLSLTILKSNDKKNGNSI